MTRSNKRKTRRPRKSRAGGALITFIALGLMAGAVYYLERHNPVSLSGRAIVVDGDSLIIDGEKLRLTGIDAPEIGQACTKQGQEWACGRASKAALRQHLRGRHVKCKSSGTDQYDRWLVTCSAAGNEINSWIVENGWAVDFGGYGREEGNARRKKLGIWQGEFEYPQEWRRANRSDASGLN